MTEDEEFANKMTAIAQVLGIEISKVTLRMYHKILKKYGLGRVNQALDEVFAELAPGQKFPTAKQIIERFAPVLDDDSQAREAAARIIAAASKFGSYRHDEAKGFIGDLGWYVVTMQGGWSTVCSQLTYDNKPTLQAQWRDLAKSAMVRSRAGTLGQAPGLPERKIGGLVGMSDIAKKLIEEKK